MRQRTKIFFYSLLIVNILFAGCQSNKGKVKVIFIGDSITNGWQQTSTNFFESNGYLSRGVNGQTTSQFLNRFSKDVINPNPDIVVINGGINDIAENLGTYNMDSTFTNIETMVNLAKTNGIKVILTSLLPVDQIPWRKEITEVPQKVNALNKRIREYAEKEEIPFVDYYTAMSDKNGTIISEYTSDGVHVTQSGYSVMEKLIKEQIDLLAD